MRQLYSRILLCCGFGLLFVNHLYGNSNSTCNAIKTTKELVQCSLQKHPELQIMFAEQKQTAELKNIAGQIPNLELDSRVLYGTDSNYGAEVNLQHTFELGGKRSARVKKAKNEISVFAQKLLIKKQGVVISLLVKLHRMRQLRHEMELIRESSATYHGVRQRFRRRLRLNPDQEMSANIYLFAINENKQHKRILENEYIRLVQEVKLFVNKDSIKLTGLLPKAYQKWPPVSQRKIESSPYLQLAKRELELSESDVDLQDALAWPDFSIGPALDYSRSKSDLPTYLGGGSSKSQADIGLSFSFKLPLYHQNKGQKEYAKKGMVVQSVRSRMLGKQLDTLRKSYVNIYQNSISSLNIAQTLRMIKTKHNRLHQLLRRGIVHTSLVIELHRQEYEFVKASHENELQALQALWAIQAIDGSIFKETTK